MQTTLAIIGGAVTIAAFFGFVRSLWRSPKGGLSGGEVSIIGQTSPHDHVDHGGHSGHGSHGGHAG
jgi:hypothetical protein